MTPSSLLELHQRGQHEEVLRLARSIDLQPTADPQTSMVVAASLFQLGRFRDALQILAVLEPIARNDSRYLNLLGVCLRRVGEEARAEQVFRFGLEQSVAEPSLSNNYVNLLIDQRRFDQAQGILQAALSSHPQRQDLRASESRLQQLLAQAASVSQLPASPPTVPQPELPQSSLLTATEPPLKSPAPRVQPEAPASPGQSLGEAPPRLAALDPLLRAFTEEEVQLDQDNRRRLRDSKASRDENPAVPAEEGGTPAVVLPELPPAPLLEVADELLGAVREALLEKKYECTLVLADLLLSIDPSRRNQLYRFCAEAYLHLGNLSAAELCLHSLVELGDLQDLDRLNLAALALRRHDLNLAEKYIQDIQDRDQYRKSLDQLAEKLAARRGEPEPLMVFTTKGLKPVRQKVRVPSTRTEHSRDAEPQPPAAEPPPARKSRVGTQLKHKS